MATVSSFASRLPIQDRLRRKRCSSFFKKKEEEEETVILNENNSNSIFHTRLIGIKQVEYFLDLLLLRLAQPVVACSRFLPPRPHPSTRLHNQNRIFMRGNVRSGKREIDPVVFADCSPKGWEWSENSRSAEETGSADLPLQKIIVLACFDSISWKARPSDEEHSGTRRKLPYLSIID